ncbi:Cellulosome-anchoring protein precursor [Paenibacillus konkukensis]|uniref:Cellulosome-anchoring protein n=1 Tax=Paenibacillus konkukensis TaxID=2020716 RepID=A0ABY4RWW9_9BACL|nr:S-layer homology domain-containing protein [Paenibacillus konkukensis]UQZ86657.1 Cellulosome-anchoring protein precursor [Paenibacillus konkukensis]
MNRLMKLTLSVLVAAALLQEAGSGTAEASSLDDIHDHWGEPQITAAVQEGYVDGYPDGTFKPEQNVSRAEFIKLVADALQWDQPEAATGAWYTPYLNASLARGIYKSGEFPEDRLEDPISREEMARMAVRAIGIDQTDTRKWLYLAALKGIINGLDQTGTLAPDEPTTRAQAVTVIGRIKQLRAGISLPADAYVIAEAEMYWHRTNLLSALPQYFDETGGADYREELSTHSIMNGNMTCSLDRYVVVDMDNPHDPNRFLVPDDLQWADTAEKKIKDVGESGIYVLVSEQTLRIQSFPAQSNAVKPCYASFMDKLYDDTGELRAQGHPYQVAPADHYTPIGNNRFSLKYGGAVTGNAGEQVIRPFTSYEVLPKGQLASPDPNRQVRVVFKGIGAEGPTHIIYAGNAKSK